jgi:hypothetical protein
MSSPAPAPTSMTGPANIQNLLNEIYQGSAYYPQCSSLALAYVQALDAQGIYLVPSSTTMCQPGYQNGSGLISGSAKFACVPNNYTGVEPASDNFLTCMSNAIDAGIPPTPYTSAPAPAPARTPVKGKPTCTCPPGYYYNYRNPMGSRCLSKTGPPTSENCTCSAGTLGPNGLTCV